MEEEQPSSRCLVLPEELKLGDTKSFGLSGNSFTISFWIFCDKYKRGDWPTEEILFSIHKEHSRENLCFRLNYLEFILPHGRKTDSSYLSEETWCHVDFVYNNKNLVTFFNGLEVSNEEYRKKLFEGDEKVALSSNSIYPFRGK
jgi:hypothetical protein